MGDADVTGQASDGGEGDLSAHASSAASLRRSKRDGAAKTDPGKSASSVQEEPAQRRSQRSVKATYATTSSTPMKEPQPAPQQSSSKKTPVKAVEEADGESSQQSIRRSRPSRGGTAADSTSVAEPMSPVKAATSSADSTTLAATPTRRRPSRRQLELDSSVARQPVDKAHLLLGRFSVDDATALCEVVWYHIKENSYKLDVLLRDRSPARIDWICVSERLAESHEVQLTPLECQRLWKFLAYARNPGNDEDATGKLMADSDPEDYELTADKINKRFEPKPVTPPNIPVEQPGAVSDDEASQVEQALEPDVKEPEKSVSEGAATPTTESPSETALTDTTKGESSEELSSSRSTLRTAGAQLFPVYDQPSGVPDGWQKPFNIKQSLPLVFVAEKFLKRKVVASVPAKTGDNQSTTSMEVDPTILAAAAMSVTLTGEKLQPKIKGRKRLSDGGNGDDTKPKKPRKKKEPVAVATASKHPMGINTNPSVTKILLPSRQSFAPSATPPPAPTPARGAFDFFCRLYKENPNIVRPTITGDDKEHGPSTVTDPAQLATIFANAPLHVRTACEQMANDDQRRFEREQLRRRLWEKALASLQSSPATSAPSTPAVASSSANPSATSQIPPQS